MFGRSQTRNIHRNVLNCGKVILKNAKNKSKSSQDWLQRQLSDPYVEKSKMMNYRCRSAFKLIEIDDRYKLIKPGSVIIDCGAAPGSWSQVAARRSNSDGQDSEDNRGIVIGMDLLRIHPVKGVTMLDGMDFTKTSSQELVKQTLNSREVDCMLSDMAPKATGIRILDHENIINLCYSVLKFSLVVCKPNASLLMKVWDTGDVHKLEKDIQKFYTNVKRVKPKSSRSDSSELFLLATGFLDLRK